MRNPYMIVHKTWLGLGYLFLYLPIFALIIYSFNASSLVTVWTHFSFKWYQSILNDHELIDSLMVSLRIAFFSATASVIMGLLTAIVLIKYRKFPGRTLFNSMVNSPLVMPEVLVGISLLLTFVALNKTFGWPHKGLVTIWLAHSLLGTSYAVVTIKSRLQEMDQYLEEAAMDLGCKPFAVFRLVTLPLITLSLLSAWLLTFTLSFDDVVLSEFTSGPGSMTLPMVIFSRARLGLNPSINAVATIMILIVTVVAIATSIFSARREKRLQSEASIAIKT